MNTAADPLVLTIDIGTSSTRVLLFDRYGRAVPELFAQEPNQLTTAGDGTAELPIDALLDTVARCLDTALAKAGGLANDIAAVAVDTLVSNFVALDDKGKALTPLILYADTRNDADASYLRKTLDEHAVHERTGCLLRTSYWPARLAWLRRTQPDVWRRASRFDSFGGYLESQLFGQSRVSTSVASWSGLLNRRTLSWDTELLAALDVSAERLGALVNASTPVQGLRAPFRERWPALAEVPWFPAIGDGAAANLGSGCVDENTMALTVGTTGALRIVRADVPAVPHGLWCYRVDTRRALLGGATSEGGNLFAWMRETLQLGADTQLDEQLAAIAPDSHGLTVLPFLAGERSPGWAGDAKATIGGLTLSTTPVEMLRAGLEAVAYRFAIIADSMLAASTTPPTVLASGGALLRSPVWMQICADAIGLPLTVSDEPEATCRGAALLALESLGVIPDLSALPARRGPTYTPNPIHHAIYRAAIQRQREWYELLVDGGR